MEEDSEGDIVVLTLNSRLSRINYNLYFEELKISISDKIVVGGGEVRVTKPIKRSSGEVLDKDYLFLSAMHRQ